MGGGGTTVLVGSSGQQQHGGMRKGVDIISAMGKGGGEG